MRAACTLLLRLEMLLGVGSSLTDSSDILRGDCCQRADDHRMTVCSVPCVSGCSIGWRWAKIQLCATQLNLMCSVMFTDRDVTWSKSLSLGSGSRFPLVQVSVGLGSFGHTSGGTFVVDDATTTRVNFIRSVRKTVRLLGIAQCWDCSRRRQLRKTTNHSNGNLTRKRRPLDKDDFSRVEGVQQDERKLGKGDELDRKRTLC